MQSSLKTRLLKIFRRMLILLVLQNIKQTQFQFLFQRITEEIKQNMLEKQKMNFKLIIIQMKQLLVTRMVVPMMIWVKTMRKKNKIFKSPNYEGWLGCLNHRLITLLYNTYNQLMRGNYSLMKKLSWRTTRTMVESHARRNAILA